MVNFKKMFLLVKLFAIELLAQVNIFKWKDIIKTIDVRFSLDLLPPH